MVYQQHFLMLTSYILKTGRHCLLIVVIDQVVIRKVKKFPITTLWWGLFFRQLDCRKRHKGEGEGLVRFSVGKHILPQGRESRTVLDSGFRTLWIPDSGILELYSGFQNLGFQIPLAKYSRIPDSTSVNFLDSRIWIPLHWARHKINLQHCGNEVSSLAIFVCKPKSHQLLRWLRN